jgi:GxxExxY protein
MTEGAGKSRGTEPINALTHAVIGAAIEVHQVLGPGLLESLYERALCHELTLRGIPHERQVSLPVRYKGELIEGSFRLDLVVASTLIVEIKAADRILPIHEAQLLSYLKLSTLHVGLLINFHAIRIKDGLKRFVLNPRF